MTAAREVVGPDCLITASYDLHGNISQRVIDQLDGFSAFSTAPHIDREETFRRACDVLLHAWTSKVRPTVVWAPIPVLMPGERSSTEYEPARRLWAQLPPVNARPGILDASLLVGYVWADEPRATASAVLRGPTRGPAPGGPCRCAAVLGRAEGVPVRGAHGHLDRHHQAGARTRHEARGDFRFRRQPDGRRDRRPRRRARRTAAHEGDQRRRRRHRRPPGDAGLLRGRRRARRSP